MVLSHYMTYNAFGAAQHQFSRPLFGDISMKLIEKYFYLLVYLRRSFVGIAYRNVARIVSKKEEAESKMVETKLSKFALEALFFFCRILHGTAQ